MIFDCEGVHWFVVASPNGKEPLAINSSLLRAKREKDALYCGELEAPRLFRVTGVVEVTSAVGMAESM